MQWIYIIIKNYALRLGKLFKLKIMIYINYLSLSHFAVKTIKSIPTKVMKIDAQRVRELLLLIPETQLTNDSERSKIVSRQAKAMVKPRVKVMNILTCFLNSSL